MICDSSLYFYDKLKNKNNDSRTKYQVYKDLKQTKDEINNSNYSDTIARLKAGEAIVLPIRSKATVSNHSLVVDGTKFLVASTDGTNYDGTIGANTIAVEFLAVGA